MDRFLPQVYVCSAAEEDRMTVEPTQCSLMKGAFFLIEIGEDCSPVSVVLDKKNIKRLRKQLKELIK